MPDPFAIKQAPQMKSMLSLSMNPGLSGILLIPPGRIKLLNKKRTKDLLVFISLKFFL